LSVHEHDFKRVVEDNNRIYSHELEDILIRRKQSSQSAIGCINPKVSSGSLSVLRQKRLQLQKRADSFVTTHNTPNEFTLDDTPKTKPVASFNSVKDDDLSLGMAQCLNSEDHTIHECPEVEVESPQKVGELSKKVHAFNDGESSASYSDISDSESESHK